MRFVAVSYNVLATAYIQPNRYRNTPAACLDPAWRVPALRRRIETLDADLLCLQEVEPETFEAVRTALDVRGFSGEYAPKRAGRPEGVAVFCRRAIFTPIDTQVLAAANGAPDATGHVTQFVRLRHGGRTLGVINTHLTWDAPGTLAIYGRGRRQAERLLAEQRRRAAEGDAWIIAGDFNVEAGSDTVKAVQHAGFRFAHQDLPGVHTCNANGAARLVDYLFYSERLQAEPIRPAPIDGRTALPSEDEPSDHLALMARFDWRA